MGDFANAKAVVNPHWLLNLPSIYMFSIYDAYINCVEFNNLFDLEQSKFLKRNYQRKPLNIKSISNGRKTMHIISTFEYSNYLELAITAVEMKGISKYNILAIPMDKRDEERKLFDTIHHSDGLSMFDLPMILATFFSIFGAIYGFILKWGPLIWGLIAIAAGFALGLIIKLITAKKYSQRREDDVKGTEVILVIECDKDKADIVKEILWNNHALGVSKLNIPSSN